jgi:hypothetical protein
MNRTAVKFTLAFLIGSIGYSLIGVSANPLVAVGVGLAIISAVMFSD